MTRAATTPTKIVVNSEEITKYGDTNVLDVLKRVPGIAAEPQLHLPARDALPRDL